MVRRLMTALCLAWTLAAFAAAQDSTAPEAGKAEELTPDSPYQRGDHCISLGAGTQVPLFVFPDAVNDKEAELRLGGGFSFTYQYFLGQGLAIGGTLSGAFNSTVGGRSLFVAPLSFRAAYWKAFMPFEFFADLEAGGQIMRLDGKGMLGPVLKAGGGALWSTGTGWSVGLQAQYWFVPEIHTGEYRALTRFGNFLETGLVAVYHL